VMNIKLAGRIIDESGERFVEGTIDELVLLDSPRGTVQVSVDATLLWQLLSRADARAEAAAQQAVTLLSTYVCDGTIRP
jgi:hypothetical protein